MELRELVTSLKEYVNSLLDREGWCIAFELTEVEENLIKLKLKDKLARVISKEFFDGQDPNLVFDIPSFSQIYDYRNRIAEEIKNEAKLKNIDSYTVYNYKQKLLFEIGGIFTRNPVLVDIYKWVQDNNYFYIYSAHIKNFFSIHNISLADIKGAKEVYFLGENGDGKSLILMGLHLAFNSEHIQSSTNLEFTGKVQEMLKANKKLSLSSRDTNGSRYGRSRNIFLKNFYCYGAQRGRYSSDEFERYGFMSLYDNDVMLYSPEKLLQQTYLLELEKRLDTNNMIPEGKPLPNWVKLESLKKLFHELLEKNVQIDVSAEGVRFNEKGYNLSFSQLSEGYKNLLIWISDLIYRLQLDQPENERLRDFRGIVLLDEIELHLHPIWQTKLVEQLRCFFPNLQFLFTTHSPTIIQGASEDAIIYRVYRDSNTGETKVSEPYFKKNLEHLMFNTLVTSPLFGLSNARISKDEDLADTSDSFLQSRISRRIEEELKSQKAQGKEFLTDQEIDSLIDTFLREELGKKDDKNK